MKPGDTVYANIPQKKGPPQRWRGVIQEMHGAVCRVRFWTGRKFEDKNMMTKELETKEEK